MFLQLLYACLNFCQTLCFLWSLVWMPLQAHFRIINITVTFLSSKGWFGENQGCSQFCNVDSVIKNQRPVFFFKLSFNTRLVYNLFLDGKHFKPLTSMKIIRNQLLASSSGNVIFTCLSRGQTFDYFACMIQNCQSIKVTSRAFD